MATKAKRYGLRVAGAVSDAPVAIPGYPGFYRGVTPTPVGGEGDALTLEEAKARIKAEAERIEVRREEWDTHEAEQEAAGRRPHGRIPFGDVIDHDEDGMAVYAPPVPPLELVEIKDLAAAEEAARDARRAVVDGVAAHRAEKLNKQETEELKADVEAAKES